MGSNNSAQRGYNRPGYNQYQNYQHPYYGYRHPGYYGYQNALPYYSSYGLPTYGVPSTYAPLVSSYPSTYIPPTTSYTPSSYYPYSSNYVPPVSSYSVSRDLSAYSSYYPTYSAPLTGLPEYGISSLSAPLAIGYNSAPTYVNNYSLPPAYISTPSTTPLLGAPTYTSPTYTTPLSFSSPLNVVAPTYTTPAITAPTYTSTYAAPTYTSNYINPTLTTPLLDGTSSILPTSTTPFIPATVLGSLPTSTDFNYAIPRQGYTLENPSQLYQGNFWQVGAPSPLSADALTRIPSNYGLAPLQVPNSAIPETILGNRNTDAVAYTAEPTNDPEFEGQEHTTPNKDLKE